MAIDHHHLLVLHLNNRDGKLIAACLACSACSYDFDNRCLGTVGILLRKYDSCNINRAYTKGDRLFR